MKAVVVFFFYLLIFPVFPLFAQIDLDYFKQFESPWLHIIESQPVNSDYPWYARWIQSPLLKRDPIGVAKPLPLDCQKGLESLNLESCQQALKTGRENIFSNTWGVMNINLDPAHHPFAKHVMIDLPGGTKLKGLLGLKGDGKKRPLLIFRLGIFSNTEEFYPERFLFLQLFEESPFNILLLESLSGSEFSKNNQKISIGGYEEGRQNYWIAKNLQHPSQPLSKIIESVHLVGVSLGGHGVFYAALLNDSISNDSISKKSRDLISKISNDLISKNSTEKPIQSFLTFCPLVNLTETFRHHHENGWTYWLMNKWAQVRLSHLFEIYPSLRHDNMIFDLFKLLNQNPYLDLMKLEADPLGSSGGQDTRSFEERNNFFDELGKITSPFYVLATVKDPIVPYELNAAKLSVYKNIHLIKLESGYHCSLSVAYDWHLLSKMYQQHFLKMSPGFMSGQDSVYQPLKEPLDSVTQSLLRRWQRAQQ